MSLNSQTRPAPVYVVLGATGGIGTALCQRLAGKGAQLVVGARDAAKLDALSRGTGAHPCPLEATDMASVDACMALAVNHYGRLDGVANCVGSLLLKPAHLTSAAEWHATLATNLGSAFATVRAAARAMMKTGGSIVLVSSVAARLGLANHEAIAAAKAGVGGLVISAAAAYAARGIRVNAVAPGMVRTPLTARLTQSEAALKRSMVWLPTWHEARDVLEDIGVDHTDVLQALQRHNALDQRRELLTLYGLIAARLEAPDSRSELTDSATTAPVPCR